MKIVYSEFFKKRLKKRLDKKPALKQKVAKQLKLLKIDFHHPSLKIHKLKGKRAEEYAIWIEGDLRITFTFLEKTILLTDLITHDQY